MCIIESWCACVCVCAFELNVQNDSCMHVMVVTCIFFQVLPTSFFGCVGIERELRTSLSLSLLSTGNFFCRTHICQFFDLFLSMREPQSLWSLLLRASRTIFFSADFDIQTHWVRKRARLTYVSVSTLKIGKQTCPNVKTRTYNANWLWKNYNF